MKSYINVISMMIVLVIFSGCAQSSWKYELFGIDYDDFKGRNAGKVIIGALASYLVHEAGHYYYAEIIKNDAAHWNGPLDPVHADDNDDWTNSEIQMFHRAGFVSQTITGSILVFIPEIRNSDFTYGFTTCTSLVAAGYVMTGGWGSDDTSDLKQLDNGELEGGMAAIVNGFYSYMSLDIPDR